MITYLVCDLEKKKQQIGSTTSLETGRPYVHFTDACPNPVLRNATRKRPQSFFVFISEDDGLETREHEQHYLDFYFDSPWCYNLSPHAEGGWKHVDNRGKVWANNGEVQKMLLPEEVPTDWKLGRLETDYHFSDETRRAISERVSGDKNPFCRPEVRERISASSKERVEEHNKNLHSELDEWGRSRHAVKMSKTKWIRCTDKSTGEELEFPSSRIAGDYLNIPPSTIRAAIRLAYVHPKYKFERIEHGVQFPQQPSDRHDPC